jgi:hypothetical protein
MFFLIEGESKVEPGLAHSAGALWCRFMGMSYLPHAKL